MIPALTVWNPREDEVPWVLDIFTVAPEDIITTGSGADEPEIMTPEHPNWGEFLDRLAAPDACNVREEVEDGREVKTWACDCDLDFPISRRILSEMGFDGQGIADCVAWLRANVGECDCEIVHSERI